MKNKKEKMNLMAKLSIIAGVIAILVALFWPCPNITAEKVAITLSTIFALASIVLGIIALKQIKKSKEKGKGVSIAFIIIGIILVLFSGVALLGLIAMQDPSFNDGIYCTEVKDCVKNEDGTSTCNYMDMYDIPCTTEYLKEEQFKK